MRQRSLKHIDESIVDRLKKIGGEARLPPNAFSRDDLSAIWGVCLDTVNSRITRMLRDGRIQRVAQGYYILKDQA